MLSLLLAVTLSVPPRSAADYALLQGRVMILTRTKEAVVIGVDTNNDGYADDLFWFFSTSAPSLNFYSDKASIEFRGDELVVIGGENGELFAFSAGPSRLAQRGAPLSSSTFSGYGLYHGIGPRVNKIYIPSPQKTGRLTTNSYCGDTNDCILYQNPDDPAAGGSTCDAGGTGASSCSITSSGESCSASCVSGYYACCTKSCVLWSCTVSCSCVKY
jgi:hypothetical protein